MIVIFALLAVLVAIFVQHKWKNRRLVAVSEKLPGPKGWPIIGSGLIFLGKNTDIIPTLKTMVKTYGSPMSFWLGPKLFILTDNPDDVQILLNAPNSMYKDEVYRFMECFGLNAGGLISISGDTWKYHRKLLNPCFTPKILESYVPIFNKCGQILTRNLSRLEEKGEKFDVLESMLACSLDLVVETSMGKQLNCQDGNNGNFLVASERFLNTLTARFFKFWLHPDFCFERSSYFPDFSEDCDVILSFCRSVITALKKKSSGEEKGTTESDEDNSPQIFINQLMKIAKGNDAFNDGEVIAETITAVLAGHETSANAMSHTILMLAMHPEAQEKVFAELKSVFKTQDAPITAEDLKELVYLEQVIKEAMRMNTVVPLYCRRVVGDIELSNGVVLPAGCHIGIPSLTLHRRKDVWGEDADEFNPDHFAPGVQRHPYAFLPFSGGPRICIGYRYAYMSMKTVLAYMLRDYQFSTDLKLDDLVWDFSVTLRLVNKHMVKAEKRVWT